MLHLQRTTVTGYYDDNFLIAVQRLTCHHGADPAEGAVRERVWRIRSARVILATGAHERPIVFEGNDVPGVMLAESVRVYLQRYGVLAGQRVVVFTAHDDAYRVAGELMAVGAVVVVVDPRVPEDRPDTPPVTFDDEVATGSVLTGSVVTRTHTGPDGVLTAVTVRGPSGESLYLPADLLAVSGGWNPAVHLYSQAGGRLEFDSGIGSFIPAGARQQVTVVGAARGLRTTAEAVADGAAAGGDTGLTGNAVILPPAEDLAAMVTEPTALYLVTDDGVDPATLTEHFVDVQRDVTVADLVRATGAGLASVEHVKRYTTAGTAHDQGKTSGLLSTAVMAHLLGVEPGELGTTTYRPPYTPISFAALAGRERGDLYDPVRTTAAHSWHVARGAEFENVGQWKRPWFYPEPGEDMETAVLRECAAARTNVAFMDGSTLGKIDVQGPDAAAFLDMLYTNLMSSLKIGMIRYGVMCTPDGMALDDGTVFRLAPERYLVTTTTGNAAKILDWMEEWLQTEWPHLKVWCASVTEQWATMAIVGPRSRALLSALAPGLPADNDDFPFMAWRDTAVAGLTARVARISFSGELAYEVNVAWHDAAALWNQVWKVGEPIGLTPYGTEAMHVLRAEKGYPIIGQDTDGTITPQDLGMSWVVSKKKADFIGKRSYARADNARPDRKHLVVPAAGRRDSCCCPRARRSSRRADLPAPPVPMLGHVTSSYRSAALDRTFALALLKGGRDRIGDTVHVVVDDVPRPVTVGGPVVVDPDGLRRDGDPHADGELDPARPPHRRTAGIPAGDLSATGSRGLSQAETAGVRIAESPLTSQVLLRVTPGSVAAARASAALGAALPVRTGEVTYCGQRRRAGAGSGRISDPGRPGPRCRTRDPAPYCVRR